LTAKPCILAIGIAPITQIKDAQMKFFSLKLKLCRRAISKIAGSMNSAAMIGRPRDAGARDHHA
jgi:hypothetical protein